MPNLLAQLFEVTYQNHLPLYTLIELTYRCNLSCKHCYIPRFWRKKKELNTFQLKNLLREIASLGGLYVVFTGGEPLLRKDIFELINFAKNLNFYVSLFTNGSLIDKSIAKKLFLNGVDIVEISLYGSKNIHDKFVGQNGVFEKVLKAIENLKKYSIKICIKTTLTKDNLFQHNFLKNLAKELGINYKYDFVVVPKNNGDKKPLDLMIDDKYIIEILKENFKNKEREDNNKLTSLNCSAGINIVAINPEGNIYPCIQLPYLLGNIRKQKFGKIWKNEDFLKIFKDLKNYRGCLNCKLLNWCNRCAGLSYIESKNLFSCSYLTKKIALIFKEIYS